MLKRLVLVLAVELVMIGVWTGGGNPNELTHTLHSFTLTVLATFYLLASTAVARYGGWSAVQRIPIFMLLGSLGALCFFAGWGMRNGGGFPCEWIDSSANILIGLAELWHAAHGWIKDAVDSWIRAKLDTLLHDESTGKHPRNDLQSLTQELDFSGKTTDPTPSSGLAGMDATKSPRDNG